MPKEPQVPITPIDPLDENFLRENIKELIAIMSSEWVEEMEHSSEEIQICTPSSTIQCQICRTTVEVLYNPLVRANLMSASFACTFFNENTLAPTDKSFRVASRSKLEALGVLHNISLNHNKIEVALDLHVFDIQDFYFMIGHSLEKLL